MVRNGSICQGRWERAGGRALSQLFTDGDADGGGGRERVCVVANGAVCTVAERTSLSDTQASACRARVDAEVQSSGRAGAKQSGGAVGFSS